jgi:hypothetical protein
MNIFRYVVRYDGGSAPRPYGGVCSLAICKPMIRRTATIGDWIIGVRSKAPDRVVYVMQVSEVVPFDRYWSDPRFLERRAGASPVPDNIYRPNARGELVQAPNPIHGHTETITDLSGRNVLVSKRFWYFGAESPQLPTDLIHLVPYPRGHSVHVNRRANDVENLELWIGTWPCGIHGVPIETTPELRDWLLNSDAALEMAPSKHKSAKRCRQ